MKKTLKNLINAGIRFIDGYFREKGNSAIYVIEEGKDLLLVDTCTQKSLKHLDNFFNNENLDYNDVKYFVITHAHLDHWGNLGALLEKCENATVLCHNNTKYHLCFPDKLVSASKVLYGEEYFKDMIGEVKPVCESKIRTVGNEKVDFGNRTLTFYEVKGHTTNHVGDSFGAKVKDSSLLPCFPPTEFDPEEAKKTLDLIESISPDRVCLTHFGEYQHVDIGLKNMRNHISKFEDYMKIVSKKFETTSDDLVEKWLVSELRKGIYVDNQSLDVYITLNAKGIICAVQKQMWNLIKTFFNEVHNKGNLEKIEEMIHPNVQHGFIGEVPHVGIEKLKIGVKKMHEMFLNNRKASVKRKSVSGAVIKFNLTYSGENNEKSVVLRTESEWEIKDGKIFKAFARVIEKKEENLVKK